MNLEITKELFREILVTIQTQYEYDENFAAKIKQTFELQDFWQYDNHRINNLLLTILNSAFAEGNEMSLIDEFLYSYNLGDYGKRPMGVRKGKREYLITDTEDLYDYLVNGSLGIYSEER
jgi:hypothetical protein